jgi:hypothetical protein
MKANSGHEGARDILYIIITEYQNPSLPQFTYLINGLPILAWYESLPGYLAAALKMDCNDFEIATLMDESLTHWMLAGIGYLITLSSNYLRIGTTVR